MYGVTAGDDGTIVGVGRTDGDFFPVFELGRFRLFSTEAAPIARCL